MEVLGELAMEQSEKRIDKIEERLGDVEVEAASIKRDVAHILERIKAFADIRLWIITIASISGAIAGVISIVRSNS